MQDEEILNIINKIDYLDMDYDLPYKPRRKKSKTEKLDFNNSMEAKIIKNRKKRLLEKIQALNRK